MQGSAREASSNSSDVILWTPAVLADQIIHLLCADPRGSLKRPAKKIGMDGERVRELLV